MVLRTASNQLAFVALVLGGACSTVEQSAPSIELERFVVIRGVGDSVDIATSLPSISDRGYIAVERIDPPSNTVAIYDSLGNYLHTVGRPGGGPGEVNRVASFGFGPGDSLWVLDGIFAGHVFAPPPSRAFVRKARFETPTFGRITSEGILSGPAFVGSRYSHPRQIGWDTAANRSFTVPNEWANDSEMGAAALAAPDRLWVASGTSYRLIQIGSDGKVLYRLQRNVEWFPPRKAQRGFPTVTRPTPWIMAMSSGPDSLLWVLIKRAHPDWEANKSRNPASQGPISPKSLSAVRLTGLYEGVLEVFDPRTGELLASRIVSGGALGFVRHDILHEVVELESGANEIHLWRVRLKR